jgi:polysaccharide export outer membrane protein
VQNESRRTRYLKCLTAAGIVILAAGCADNTAAPGHMNQAKSGSDYNYVIGPGDQLQLFVWKSPELSTTATVRPDGKISIPLIEDIQAAGRTPTSLGHDIRDRLAEYVHDPIVTVMPMLFVGPFDHQIRVIGEAVKPRAFSYRADMTVLDVMIEVGGLTTFAAGNRAEIVRKVDGKQEILTVRLDSLVKDGDVTANVPMVAGDILIIPESWF